MTLRQQIADMLRQPRTISSVAHELKLTREEVEDHLKHLLKTAKAEDRSIKIEPASPVLSVVELMEENESASVIVVAVSDTSPAFPGPKNEELDTLPPPLIARASVASIFIVPAWPAPDVLLEIDAPLSKVRLRTMAVIAPALPIPSVSVEILVPCPLRISD